MDVVDILITFCVAVIYSKCNFQKYILTSRPSFQDLTANSYSSNMTPSRSKLPMFYPDTDLVNQ